MRDLKQQFWHLSSSCYGKKRFSHAAHAKVQMQKLLRSGKAVNADRLAIYHCDACAGYHIGHKRIEGEELDSGEGPSMDVAETAKRTDEAG